MRERRAEDYPFYDIPGPIAIAHRGGNAAGSEKENSLAAFESAQSAGIIYAEIDVVASKDGRALSSHGSGNWFGAKLSGLPLRSLLENQTYSEIKEKIRVGGEIIPTLEEVLSSFPNMRFFIDLKTPGAIKPIIAEIDRLSIQDRVSVGTDRYGQQVATVLKERGKDVCMGVGGWGAVALKASGITSVHIPHHELNKRMIEKAHDLGIHVITWPKHPKKNDHRHYIESSLEQGVDGVKSDHTEEVVSVFTERGFTDRFARTWETWL